MVLISGNKYACETCIKGHRSSTCRHTERPLFEIKKKGRPVTQCEHCRELRKTKQVHVKCICEAKEDHVGTHPSSYKKGHTNIPDSATFPNGLPETLGTSVAGQVLSEGTSSDVDYINSKSKCICKLGGPCQCYFPRQSAPRNRRKDAHYQQTASDQSDILNCSVEPSSHGSRTPSHILARLAELRPVQPRPSGPLHDPSYGYAVRHHPHENLGFSPYGRAYDLAHEQLYNQAEGYDQNFLPPNYSMSSSAPISIDEQIFRDQSRALEASTTTSSPSFPTTCGCGNECGCPGCEQHRGINPTTSPNFSSCTNPEVCGTCPDCTILSSLLPDMSLSVFDTYQTESIDEWIRQVSSLLPSPPATVVSPTIDDTDRGPTQPHQHSWDNYISPIKGPTLDAEYGYDMPCKCSPGRCECEADNEHCNCKNEMATSTLPTSSVVGDNAVPYGQVRSHSAGVVYPDVEFGRYLTASSVPRSRSSSVSSSSQSSLSHYPHQSMSHNYPMVSNYSFPVGRVRRPFPHTGSFSSPDLGKGLQAAFPTSRVTASSNNPSLSHR